MAAAWSHATLAGEHFKCSESSDIFPWAPKHTRNWQMHYLRPVCSSRFKAGSCPHPQPHLLAKSFADTFFVCRLTSGSESKSSPTYLRGGGWGGVLKSKLSYFGGTSSEGRVQWKRASWWEKWKGEEEDQKRDRPTRSHRLWCARAEPGS